MTQSPSLGAVVGAGASGAQVRQDFNLADQALATEHEGAFAPPVTYPFMRWRNDTGKRLYRRNAANTAWSIVENYGAVADPTTGDDAADGYTNGSLWINVSAGRVFFCAEPSTGAAVWTQAGGGGVGGVASIFGRTGAVAATAGDYTADKISDGGGKVIMTSAERTSLAAVKFPTQVIPLAGTASSADNAAIRAAIAAIKASGQPGEILMSGDFMIGHSGDMTGIDPDTCPYLKLTGRGYCRWYKGVAATTIGLTGGDDPADGTAYRLLSRATDDGPGKTMIISNIIFEGDLATTMKQLGDGSRLIALDYYDRVELHDVEGRWASQMGFTFGYCDQVRASRIYLNRIARDGLNASNSADVAVTDSDFEWVIDDCCAANLSAIDVGDAGQQRAFRFLGNRVYNCQGVKLLGGKHVLIVGNSFRAPLNYAVFLGSDASYGEGARPIEDVLVLGNTVTDLVTAGQFGSQNVVDTAIIVSQFSAVPRNVVIRGNNLAQRTATDGLNWADLKLRGIAGENRQWRRDETTGDMLFYDPLLSGEIFVGQGKAVRVEAPNGLDRLTFDIDDNRWDGFSDDAFLRSQPAWEGSQLWTVPATAGEFPVGAGARISGLDLRGYQQMRLVLSIGTPSGPAEAVLYWRFSVDGGATWVDTPADIALDGAAEHTFYGAWQDIPAALRQSVDVLVALFGQGGVGSQQVRVTDFALDIRGLDQTSAARLLPTKITPAEKASPVGTELRSFAPADIADMAGGLAGLVSSVFGRAGAVTAQDGDYTAAQVSETAALKIMTAAERSKLAALIEGSLNSVFGRTGAVVAASGDYTAGQVSNTPAGGIAATTVQAALNALDAQKQPLAALLTALAAISAPGLLVRTGTAAAAARSIAAGSGISVSNGDGVAGNPTIATAMTLALLADMTAYWRGRAAADPVATIQSLLAAADAAAALTGLGVSAYVQTLLDDADAAAARGTLGGTAAGQALFTAASYAAVSNLLIPARDWRGRNVLLNGNFDVWQRGTSLSAASGARYLADRWQSASNGSTHAPSRQAFAPGQTDVPGEPTYYLRTVVASVAGAANLAALAQYIEGVRTLAGQTATLSFYAKADAAKPLAVEFVQNFGSGGSPSAGIIGIGATKLNLTTSWQKFTVPVTLPSIAGKTVGTNNDNLTLQFWLDAGSDYNARSSTLGQQSGTFDIAQVQLEAGSVATPFDRRAIATELALCHRYCALIGSAATGAVGGATNATPSIRYPVKMRSVPTLSILAGGVTVIMPALSIVTAASPSVGSIYSITDTGVILDIGGFVGLTSGHACSVYADCLLASAEL